MTKTTKTEKSLLVAPVDGLIRVCLLPSCDVKFKPEPSNKEFCCSDHQREGHKLAKKIGTEIVLSGTLHCECRDGVFINGEKGE